MTTPHCHHCRAPSPGCLALQKLDQFGLVYCKQCGAIFGVVSLPAQPAQPKPDKKPASMLETIGNADLSEKQPYDPVQIANRMKAAGMGSNRRYLQIAIDDGPPLCSQHKCEMSRATIPDGYKNSGREVWLCPHFNACGQWELAK